MKAVLKKTRNNQFRFNLVGNNGEKIATSETYTSKAMAKKTLKKYFSDFTIIDITLKKQDVVTFKDDKTTVVYTTDKNKYEGWMK